jgi:Transposase, Mutator family
MDEHLGYEKHDVSGRGSGNSRNGTRTKTVLTEIGPVEIDVPRDTGSTFDPQIVRKRQRRLTGIDEIVLSLSAKGLTTGDIAAHFAEVFGARVSKDTISRITAKVIGEMTEWQNRMLPCSSDRICTSMWRGRRAACSRKTVGSPNALPASRIAAECDSASASRVSTRRMPRPPPATALAKIGKPIFSASGLR